MWRKRGKDGGKDGVERAVLKEEEREGMGVFVDGGKGSRGKKAQLFKSLYSFTQLEVQMNGTHCSACV